MEIRNNYQVDYCFILPNNLRNQLAKPYGILFINDHKLFNFLGARGSSRIITVGDVVTRTLLSHNIIPFLPIIDGKTKRKIEVGEEIISERVVNEAGLIRLSAILKIERLLKSETSRGKVLYVEGEEDLLVIPAVIYGRNGDIVLYGQPNAGVVALVIDNFMRKRVLEIFTKFKVVRCDPKSE
ncbi:GTP-dependent dephospho-CoA kinase family protein [Stygiolobus caldivivus]|uniref:GTP-dependent dephospho-CoA kinase n=1 Tax=Stygiolobus caldivivus TaxID=2824673 RepID=A0A8D5U7E8_9CREN|nr:DUF359 domain-containing protein [Stygiolobus caldivivus]BCU70698.1 hypothetical protein KN1_19950 [Stygiolobus caldivivus]